MHFDDLSPYVYGGSAPSPRVQNIGWLSNAYPFPTGRFPESLLGKLESLTSKPINLKLGFHVCEFCPEPESRTDENGLRIIEPAKGAFGNGEIRIVGSDGVTYVAPVMISHYIQVHARCNIGVALFGVFALQNAITFAVGILALASHPFVKETPGKASLAWKAVAVSLSFAEAIIYCAAVLIICAGIYQWL